MTKKRNELKQRVTRAIITHAFFRLESALIIAMTIILTTLFPMPFPWWQWWYWLVIGVVAEGLIIYTSLTDPAGLSYVYAYDSNGNLIHSTDPLGSSTSFTYTSAFNRLASVTDANGNVTGYAYDADGNLIAPLAFTWSTNDSAASVDGNGLFDAATAGTWAVNATSGGKTGTALVTVIPGVAAVITLSLIHI